MNNLQPVVAFMFIFIAIFLRLCDQVDSDPDDFGVSHLKNVV